MARSKIRKLRQSFWIFYDVHQLASLSAASAPAQHRRLFISFLTNSPATSSNIKMEVNRQNRPNEKKTKFHGLNHSICMHTYIYNTQMVSIIRFAKLNASFESNANKWTDSVFHSLLKLLLVISWGFIYVWLNTVLSLSLLSISAKLWWMVTCTFDNGFC